jgi:hypothetical protein
MEKVFVTSAPTEVAGRAGTRTETTRDRSVIEPMASFLMATPAIKFFTAYNA